MKVWTVQGRDMPQNKKTDKADADIVQAEEGQKLHGQFWKTAKAKKSSQSGRFARSEKTARECALALLEFRDRTERELRQKLKEREYGPEEIEETVLFLKEYRYLDDEAYAGRYIRSCASRKSRRQIRADLERKGVSREVIDLSFQEEAVDEESQIEKLLLKKGYEPGKRMEPADYRRLMGTLGRRGFSSEAIRRVTDRMSEDAG
ncbi:regulatory protein RecX [Clostridium sp. AM42-4]|uniref:regulatory protein RecX n=1 Tax=Clostridium sp. AM42-4 TaxID=2292305 RepID=UPI000E556811|nr:regulatory protein RecX [Clostridium sp. AM42-4]RHS90899.1 regulatory protein RecX [Clostridium sp. AM42-4]HBM48302.1 recombinase RecX [Lachnoclostridium sp.]